MWDSFMKSMIWLWSNCSTYGSLRKPTMLLRHLHRTWPENPRNIFLGFREASVRPLWAYLALRCWRGIPWSHWALHYSRVASMNIYDLIEKLVHLTGFLKDINHFAKKSLLEVGFLMETNYCVKNSLLWVGFLKEIHYSVKTWLLHVGFLQEINDLIEKSLLHERFIEETN